MFLKSFMNLCFQILSPGFGHSEYGLHPNAHAPWKCMQNHITQYISYVTVTSFCSFSVTFEKHI